MNGISKLGAPLAAVAAAAALIVAPSASAMGQYADSAGDNGTAGDITGLNVTSDAAGQIVIRVSGNGLSTSETNVTWILIDADANPLSGNLDALGADYAFVVDDDTYDFGRWDGSGFVDTPYTTVDVSGGSRGLTISVNRSELGNTSEFNFWARTFDRTTQQMDDAPDSGMFNYSLALQGVHILSAVVETAPAAGPKAGKPFAVKVPGVRLPPTGVESLLSDPKPQSYSCKATVSGRALNGAGTGGCTWRVPKTARGKALKVVVTVVYEGTKASFPYSFRVR
jgi:hypothetical protein